MNPFSPLVIARVSPPSPAAPVTSEGCHATPFTGKLCTKRECKRGWKWGVGEEMKLKRKRVVG